MLHAFSCLHGQPNMPTTAVDHHGTSPLSGTPTTSKTLSSVHVPTLKDMWFAYYAVRLSILPTDICILFIGLYLL